jgi:hypothetical protein
MKVEASQREGLAKEACARKGSFLNVRPLSPCKREMNYRHQPDGEALVTPSIMWLSFIILPHTVLQLHRVESRDEARHGVLQPQYSASSLSGLNSSEYMVHYHHPTIRER